MLVIITAELADSFTLSMTSRILSSSKKSLLCFDSGSPKYFA